jgi:hypothetical protein
MYNNLFEFEQVASSIRENVYHARRYNELMALDALENVAIDLADIFGGMPVEFDRESFMVSCGLESDL